MKTLLVLLALPPGADAPVGGWTRLPPLPDKEGFAGAFAGVSRGALVVAGGANFPDRKPWEGGKKVWHDTVFVLERPDGEWKAVGRLPRPLGYGVSASHGAGVVCVGGSDASRHYADAFRLEWTGGRLVTTALPALPKPVANACGALVGDTLYVAGGQERPDSPAQRDAWKIDLSAPEPRWIAIEPVPGGGRMLSVAAGHGGTFCVVGGAELVDKGGTLERRYLRDAYRFDPRRGWERVADLPHPVAAAPSPAPTDGRGFLLLGGDDGSQVGVDHDRHRGFGREVLRYDPTTGMWAEAGTLSAPRVTAPCVRWGETWVVPSGESRPGVRSPEVWSFTPGKKD
jgi:N-acetylneuraminic acid mutarotase